MVMGKYLRLEMPSPASGSSPLSLYTGGLECSVFGQDLSVRAGLSLVDTFSSSKTNETLNMMSQLSMIFTTHVFIAMKITAHGDSWFSTVSFVLELEVVSTNERPARFVLQIVHLWVESFIFAGK